MSRIIQHHYLMETTKKETKATNETPGKKRAKCNAWHGSATNSCSGSCTKDADHDGKHKCGSCGEEW